MKKYFASSELIINDDGSVFHLHVKPEWLADKVILVGDPGRVALVGSHLENKECEVESREFKTITDLQGQTHHGGFYGYWLRQHRYCDERTGRLGQHRLQHT